MQDAIKMRISKLTTNENYAKSYAYRLPNYCEMSELKAQRVTEIHPLEEETRIKAGWQSTDKLFDLVCKGSEN